MTFLKFALGGVAVVAVASILGCGEPPKTGTPPANTNAAPTPNANRAPAAGEKIVRDEAGPDNSHIRVRELANGNRVSVRLWDAGPVSKVTRREQNGEVKALRVIYRNGRIVRVESKDASDHIFDWTAAQFDDVAKKSGKIVEDAPARGQASDDDDDK